MALTIESAQQGGWDVVTVAGEVDITTAPELRDCLAERLDDGTDRLVVDLRAVDFLDSTALSVMVGAHKRLMRRDSRLALVCTSEPVLRVLSATGLSRVFAVHPTLEDALAGPADR